MSNNVLTDFLSSVFGKLFNHGGSSSEKQDSVQIMMEQLETKKQEIIRFKCQNVLSESDARLLDDSVEMLEALRLWVNCQKDLLNIKNIQSLYRKIKYLQKDSRIRFVMPRSEQLLERMFTQINDSIETKILMCSTLKVMLDELRSDTKADKVFCDQIMSDYSVHYEKWVELDTNKRINLYLSNYIKQ